MRQGRWVRLTFREWKDLEIWFSFVDYQGILLNYSRAERLIQSALYGRGRATARRSRLSVAAVPRVDKLKIRWSLVQCLLFSQHGQWATSISTSLWIRPAYTGNNPSEEQIPWLQFHLLSTVPQQVIEQLSASYVLLFCVWGGMKWTQCCDMMCAEFTKH